MIQKLKDGTLNAYALMCGYVDSTESDGLRVELYREHDCYQVRLHDDDNKVYNLVWKTFDLNQLTMARKLYKQFKGLIK